MNIEEQTVCDAHTGITLAFRQGVIRPTVEISVGRRRSTLHFDGHGQVMSITPHVAVPPCSAHEGLTPAEAAE